MFNEHQQDEEQVLELDRYMLCDPATGYLRLTATGRQALAGRLARAGIDYRILRTLEDFETALTTMTYWEFKALSDAEKDDDEVLDAIRDIQFMLDSVYRKPLWPLAERRARRRRAEQRLMEMTGVLGGVD